MRILEGIEPRAVFEHFEEICRIPHGSGNTQMISDHLVSFARKRQLEYRQDQYGNVIIRKAGSKGYEESAPVILQAHMDMVAVKDEDVEKDMTREAIDLTVDGDYIYAKGTSLGADNGVGLSYILAVLSDNDLPHPPIEAVFTVDEELGLVGAGCIDVSDLKSKMMINVDSEKEGTLIVSSAGGAQVDLHIPFKEERITGTRMQLHMDGFRGGHSGVQIKRGTLNAVRAMGRVLYGLSGITEICLVRINGGDRDNAIPVWCEAEVILCGKEADEDNIGKRALKNAHEIFDTIRVEYESIDPEISLSCNVTKNYSCSAFTKEDTSQLIAALINLPCGIQRRNPQIADMVQTSLNMGAVRTCENEIKIVFSVRSASFSERDFLIDRLKAFALLLGGTVNIHGIYPGWAYRDKSRVRDVLEEAYVDLYGEKPMVHGVHAGLECALFISKIPDLDAISIGPDLFDIHTSREKMSIPSARRTWQLLITALEKLK